MRSPGDSSRDKYCRDHPVLEGGEHQSSALIELDQLALMTTDKSMTSREKYQMMTGTASGALILSTTALSLSEGCRDGPVVRGRIRGVICRCHPSHATVELESG